MKKSTQILYSIVVLVFTSVMFSSCVKKDFDDLVTANVDPNLTPTHTIKELQAYATGTAGEEITEDIIIVGVVVGDDASGNIYKKVTLQQDSSGISVQVDISNFYTEYPVGRRVFVKCKGLYIANNGGNYELGNSPANPVGRIPAALVSQYLVKGKWGQYITPRVYPLSDASIPNKIPTNTLVKFTDVQFQSIHAGIAYAATSPSNLIIQDCASTPNEIILYSSTYSTFAFSKTPYGKGSITGVFTIYSGDPELQIRDLNDVQMNDLRCDGSTGIPVQMPIDSVRMLFTGTSVACPAGKYIRGTIISDYINANGQDRNFVIQENNAGIVIRCKSAHTFPLGSVVEVKLDPVYNIAEFNGLLQISNVDNGAVTIVGNGAITPRIATISDILINYGAWESTLITVQNATIVGSGTTPVYWGNDTLRDATGYIFLYTKFTPPTASFYNTPYPTGVVNVTAVLGEYTSTTFTPQLSMRNTLDATP